MIKRLINFYKNSSPDTAQSSMSQIWQGITSVYQKKLFDALKSENEESVAHELDQFVVSGGSHGMEYSPDIYSLPHPGLDRSQLNDEELAIPSVSPGSVGKTFSGMVALLIHQLRGGVPKNVLEIGAGLGFVGVIMSKWGAKSYTDIDLPTNALAAAFFFSRCCGEDQVFLGSEPVDPNSRFASYYSATNFAAAKNRKYDLMCNINSFPEIPNHMQDSYVNLISECLDADGIFLSINHENTVLGQRSVTNAMKSCPALVCVSKKPAFFGNQLDASAGYKEEIYKKA